MAFQRGYQHHYSRGKSVLKDAAGRFQKFKKIMSVIQDFRPGTKSLRCLDIGCSSGLITSFLGDHFGMVVGMDIDREAIQEAHGCASSTRAHFLAGDSMFLPFRNNTVDVMVCNHVYEHVPDASQMMEEIYRVLKQQGVCYFAAGNKYMLIEGHYHLPFLSWVPKPLAHWYLKLTGRGNFYYENHLSLRGLKRLVHRFEIKDYTLSIIRDPQKYSATDFFWARTFLSGWTQRLAPYLYPLIPTYIWMLMKK
jgi:ubiquinone/menaquinone biosynthesis C-methylase UbiE